MFIATVQLFQLSLNPAYYWFVFLATLTSYSLHWFFTNDIYDTISEILPGQFRALKNQQLKPILFIFFLLGSFALIFLLRSYPISFTYILPAAIATLFYTAPKIPAFNKLEGKALGKTIYLSAIWVYVTVLLPFECANQKMHASAWWYLICQFCFVYIICLLFDYRDQQKDKLNYVLLNTIKHFDIILIVISLVFHFALFCFYANTHQLYYSLGLLFSYLFLLLTMSISKKSQSDYWFYLILDGLMCLPSLVGVIFQYLLNK